MPNVSAGGCVLCVMSEPLSTFSFVDSSAGFERGCCTCTHRFPAYLTKATCRLAVQRARLVKEEVESRQVAKFGEDLYESIPRARHMAFGSILHVQYKKKVKGDTLVHDWMVIAKVKTVLEQVPRPFLSTR